MGLSKEEMERYARQIMLEEVGAEGQELIRKGRVLMAGLGGLGSPAAFYLAAAGVGTIGLIDGDVVETGNLQRQILHVTADTGRVKVDSARERLHALNPHCRLITYQEPLKSENIAEIINKYDIIIDGVDNFPARLLINQFCVQNGKVFVHGGVQGFNGQLMTVVPGQGPCLQCMLPHPASGEASSGDAPAGVMGVLPGIIGTLQAAEALKYLLGKGELLIGRLLAYNALDMRFVTLHVQRDPLCPACGFE